MSLAVSDHFGPWTVEDVLALPEDARHRIELVGGALLMSPNPGVPHQRASLRLAMHLHAAIAAAGAPFEVLEAINVLDRTVQPGESTVLTEPFRPDLYPAVPVR
ncbi:hypothetical protein [Kitasatospora griseola]|uniref:hypothetical protein n=1 Tax=Kitasatospora griseola TaxID=2064 RepID=UPI00381B39DD